MAVESADGSNITSIHDTPLMDSDGNSYGLILSAYFGLRVVINDEIDASTAEVVLLLYYDHTMYYETEEGNFFSKLNLANIWRQTTDPRVAIPKSLSIMVPTTITANQPFLVSGTLKGYTITPQLQYQSTNQTSWTDLPFSANTTGSFKFVHPGLPAVSGVTTLSVRDKNIANVGVTSGSLPLVKAAESVEGTVLSAGDTGSMVDASGNFWSIDNDGFVYKNASLDTTVPEALMLYYSNHAVFYQDPQQAWRMGLPDKSVWQLAISPYIQSPATTTFKIDQATQSLRGLVSALTALVYRLQPNKVID
jgi:hypothetical protein